MHGPANAGSLDGRRQKAAEDSYRLEILGQMVVAETGPFKVVSPNLYKCSFTLAGGSDGRTRPGSFFVKFKPNSDEVIASY